MNKNLKTISEKFQHLFCYFKDDNVLAVSEDKASLPFMTITYDTSVPENLIISYSIDYPCVSHCAVLLLQINDIMPVVINSDFYISKNGQTYFGLDANKMYHQETSNPLVDIKPTNNSIH